jgi:hypothetical protein
MCVLIYFELPSLHIIPNRVVENIEELKRFVPRSYPRVLQENKAGYTNPLAYTSFILGGVATVCVLVVAAMTVKQKSRRVIVYAQVEFMLLLMAGVLLVSIAAMIQAIRPTNFRCVTIIWLINLGYTLELVPLIDQSISASGSTHETRHAITKAVVRSGDPIGFNRMFLFDTLDGTRCTTGAGLLQLVRNHTGALGDYCAP